MIQKNVSWEKFHPNKENIDQDSIINDTQNMLKTLKKGLVLKKKEKVFLKILKEKIEQVLE